MNGVENNYQTFNGKEWDQSLDLNTFDLGARQMDPALGRFMVIDPMADFVNYQSPYAVADNNPIGLVDVYGLGSAGDGGLWRWLRNLFKGKCNCRGSGKLGRKAKKRKKPKRRKKKRTSKPKDDDGSDEPREPVKRIYAFPEGLTELSGDLDFGFPEIRIPNPPPRIPEFGGTPIKKPLTVSLDVKFKPSSSGFKDTGLTEKTLNKLIKTLKEYPQLKVLILGNTSYKTSAVVTTSSGAMVNGRVGSVGELQLKRARAVEQFLISRGINWSRIGVGNGTINTTGGTSNMSSTFIITNPNN